LSSYMFESLIANYNRDYAVDNNFKALAVCHRTRHRVI